MHKLAQGNSAKTPFALINELPHCWTGTYNAFHVEPRTIDEGRRVVPTLLLLGIRRHERGRGTNAGLSVHGSKKCYNPHEETNLLRLLPWSMSNHVLNKCS